MGQNTVSASLYGKSVSKTISILPQESGSFDIDPNNNDNSAGGEGPIGDLYYVYRNSVNEVSQDASLDSNVTDHTNNNSVAKSIDNPKPNSGNNNIWWIILLIAAIVVAGVLIKKYKN